MHGRVKTRTTEEQKEKIRQEKCKKAEAHKNSMKIVLEKRSSSICDQEALDITASLLTGNPDIITLWNYRREIFLKLRNDEDLDSYQKLLEKDLNLTEQCLRVNPKSYGSWHHRIWVLDNLPRPDWEKELKLCTKFLQLDERNFHCWDYRRIVTQRSNVPDESEYKYTLEKIESNFSNYSAWHLRSKLLPKIFPDPEGRFPINVEKHKEELELVENAAFTDPNDQSAWFYLRWLLGLTEPKVSLVYVETTESEIFVVTSRSVRLGDESQFRVKIKVKINEKPADGIWKSTGVSSCLWTYKLKSKMQPTDSVQLTLEAGNMEYSTLSLQVNSKIQNQPNFYPTFSDSLKEALTNQLSSCEQLLELEPHSKWTLLTSIFLMLFIDSSKYEIQVIESLDKLTNCDPLRKGYYLDLKSKILIQFYLDYNFSKTKKFNLTKENLTALFHGQYLYNFEEVNLSRNYLTSETLNQFYALVNCKILNLSLNNIKSLKEFPVLPKLEVLILDNNMIEMVDENWVRSFPQLKKLNLYNNPVTDKNDMIDENGYYRPLVFWFLVNQYYINNMRGYQLFIFQGNGERCSATESQEDLENCLHFMWTSWRSLQTTLGTSDQRSLVNMIHKLTAG